MLAMSSGQSARFDLQGGHPSLAQKHGSRKHRLIPEDVMDVDGPGQYACPILIEHTASHVLSLKHGCVVGRNVSLIG